MRVSDHCYAASGFAYIPPWGVNAGFVVGEGATLIVDSGPSPAAAETILGYALSVRPGNALRLVNTERHLDHIIGNSVFHNQGIDIYGHASIARTDDDLRADVEEYNTCIPDMARRAAREGRLLFADARIVNPSHPLEKETVFDLGGVHAEIIFTPGHTPANLCVFVAEERVLFCGDSLVPDYQPNLGGGGPDEWRQWRVSLDRIAALAPIVAVPGHGRILRSSQDVAAEIGRLACILEQSCG
jgi:cyclase